MSQTFELVCHATKQKIWIGQGRDGLTNFYSGMPEVMERLKHFFEATRGHELILMCTDTEGGGWCDYDDYEEFETRNELD